MPHAFCLNSVNLESEFDKITSLSNTEPQIFKVDPTFGGVVVDASSLGAVLEKKMSEIADPITESLLQKNNDCDDRILKTLHDLVSRLDSSEVTHYFRAGRNYITITHGMGSTGNLFFRAVFAKLGIDNCFVSERQGSICVICRI